MKARKILAGPIFILIIFLVGCHNGQTPKPRGYYRITFPEKHYRELNLPLPYNFQVPVYSSVTPDLLNPGEKDWITVDIPGNKAQIHISYKKINQDLGRLIEESRSLVFKHAGKASAIDERLFVYPEKHTYGTLYTLKGNAASPMQFYLTDSVRNFLRGALYISEIPNYDSLKPVIRFLSEDVMRMVATTEWRDQHGR